MIKLYIVCLVVSLLLYFMLYVTDVKRRISQNIMPISYIILVAGILVPVYHSNLYMVDENKDIISEQLQKVGFITFNRRLEYMGCSDYASDVFTELKDNEVGRPLKNTGLELHVILESLKKYAGTHFDRALAEVFLSCRSELEDYYDHCS